MIKFEFEHSIDLKKEFSLDVFFKIVFEYIKYL